MYSRLYYIFYFLDIVSLYPTILRSYPMPLGHPAIIHGDSLKKRGKGFSKRDVNNHFGIYSLKIRPPKQLHLPVLPIKGKKLVFGLCQKCANEVGAKDALGKDIKPHFCECSDEERMIEGKYCSVEILLALRQGYEIEEIYQIWHYENTSTEIFTEYIEKFYKMKTECSELPQGIETPEELCQKVSDSLDIEIDPKDIKFNASKRKCSKLLLNRYNSNTFYARLFCNSILQL